MTASAKKTFFEARKSARFPEPAFALDDVLSFSYQALYESKRKAASARFRSTSARRAQYKAQ
jgi:hypothetical protein